MQLKTPEISIKLCEYVLAYGVREHSVLSELRQYTAKLPNAQLQISPDQGQLMGLLAKIIGAKNYLELGVYTGYSSLLMALAMGKNSNVFALDNNQEYLNIAMQFWIKANVNSQIKVKYGTALDSLAALLAENKHNYFDIAFIDANKADYGTYYEYCYQLVRPGGLILIDNVLFHGKVVEEHPANFVKAIKDLNRFIHTDQRVDISLLPLADGLTIARKKEICT